MKSKLLTGIAVGGVALAVAAAAFADGFGDRGRGWRGGDNDDGGYGMMGRPMMMMPMPYGYGQMPYGAHWGGHEGWGHHHRYDSECGAKLSKPMTADDAKAFVQQRLERHGEDLLKVGKATVKDGKIVVEIVTKDGLKPAHRIQFDATTGQHRMMD